MTTWFITGASRGFGREVAIEALSRGDQVAATARSVDALADLADKFGDLVLPIALDVTDRRSIRSASGSCSSPRGASPPTGPGTPQPKPFPSRRSPTTPTP